MTRTAWRTHLLEKHAHTDFDRTWDFATDFFPFMVSLVNSRSERSWLVVCACPVNAGKLSGLQCSFVGWLGSDAKSWMGHRDGTSYDDCLVLADDQKPSHLFAWPPWDDSTAVQMLLFPPPVCRTRPANGKFCLPDNQSLTHKSTNVTWNFQKADKQGRK